LPKRKTLNAHRSKPVGLEALFDTLAALIPESEKTAGGAGEVNGEGGLVND